jgi:hypothetical protein
MRKILLVLCAGLIAMGGTSLANAGTFNAKGQFIGTVSPQIAALFREFPAGGPGLADAIARAAEANPSLTNDVLFVARSASRDQKLAVAAGLAQATHYFADCRARQALCAAGERVFLAALQFADPEIREAYLTDLAPITAAEGQTRPAPLFVPGAGAGGASVNRCVSPSSPTGC